MTVIRPEGIWKMQKRTPLTRAINKMYGPNEQKRYNRLIDNSMTAARRAANRGSSLGRITPAEKRAIARAAKAVRLVATPGEARGVKQKLRRKARRS